MAIKDNVQGVVLALFGASAGGHLAGLTAAATANGITALAGDLASSAGFILGKDLSTAAAFRDNMLSGLGITSANSAYAAAAAWADGELAKPNANRGEIVATAVSYLAGLTDATSPFYAAATAYKAAVAAAVTWSEGAGATVFSVSELQAQQGSVSAATGSTFVLTTATGGKIATLTTGSDTVNATTNADTLDAATLVDSSLNDKDVINAVITAKATPSLIANVETLNVDFNGFGVELAAGGITYGSTGGATINATTSQIGNDGATISGLSIGNVNVAIDKSIKNLTLTGTANANDATKLTLAGGALALTSTASTGVENITLSSVGGSANTVTFTGNSGTGNTVKVSGDQDTVIKAASSSLNSVQVAKNADYAKGLTVDVTSTASGAASGVFSNVAADKIVFSAAVASSATPFFANKANVSVNAVSAFNSATLNLAQPVNAQGVASTGALNTLNLSIDKASGLASGDTVIFGDKVATLNLAAANAIGSGTGTGGAPVIKITDTASGTGATQTVNITGSSAVNMVATGLGNDATDRLVVNANSFAGTSLTLYVATATGVSSIFGSAAADSLTASGAGGSTIVGGAGNDTITGGSGADSVLAGDGADTIVLSAGADSIYGGAGADSFRVGANTGTTIQDFTYGEDKIVITGATTLLRADSVLLSSGVLTNSSGTGSVTLKNASTALANVNEGVADDWSATIVYGTSAAAATVASGTARIVGGTSADNLSVANGGASGAGDRIVSLGEGADKITLTGANGAGTNNGVTLSGGAGDDTIILSVAAGSGGAATVQFGATAAANGNDMITGFATSGATGQDKLDFSAFLGATGLVAYVGTSGTGTTPVAASSGTGLGAIDFTAGVASGTGAAGSTGANDVFVVYNGTTTITASSFTSTLTAGKIAVEEGSKSVVLLAVGSTAATDLLVYYVENGPVAGTGDLSVTLVGEIYTNSGSAGDIVYTHFA